MADKSGESEGQEWTSLVYSYPFNFAHLDQPSKVMCACVIKLSNTGI